MLDYLTIGVLLVDKKVYRLPTTDQYDVWGYHAVSMDLIV
jgi:hypothetical protein